MQPSEDSQLDEEVYLYFSQERGKGVPVSGPFVRKVNRLSGADLGGCTCTSPREEIN